MNSGIVSGQSVSPTADLTYFRTQFALDFALTVSTITHWTLHDLETQNSVLGKILKTMSVREPLVKGHVLPCAIVSD
jgi:hypothetical protein